MNDIATHDPEVIRLRKRHDQAAATLQAIFNESGPDRNLDRITSLKGSASEKIKEIARIQDGMELLDQEIKSRLRAAGRGGSERAFAHPGERSGAGDDRFENLGDFVIKAVTNGGAELKAMGIDVGEAGGFLIPDNFSQNILMIPPQQAIIMPRALVMPPGSYPDGKLDVPALRQGASGILGGISFTAANEGTAGQSNDPKLDMITLEPQRISGYVTVGNSLLRNAPAMSAFIETLFRNDISAWLDYQFLQGPGLGYPLGMLNAPGAVKVNRATASTIHFADIAAMLQKQIGPNPIWIASQSAMGQIISIADANGNAMWIPAAKGGIAPSLPQTLAGLPIIFTFRTPTLGNTGDLMLVDPSLYLVKLGSGPYIQASEHVLFTSDQTVVKATLFVDGQPWCKTPVVLDDNVSVGSPYVILQ